MIVTSYDCSLRERGNVWMAKEKEMEVKNLLTKTEFQLLCENFGITEDQFTWQTNIYYDTPEFSIRKKQASLRTREKNDSFELTLKQKADIGKWETNQTISRADVERLKEWNELPEGEVKSQLIQLFSKLPSPIESFGSLQTKRAEIPYQTGTLFLDHSVYLDKEDFEIEIEGESMEEVESLLHALLSQYDIPKRKTKSKIKRFFTRLQELQQSTE